MFHSWWFMACITFWGQGNQTNPCLHTIFMCGGHVTESHSNQIIFFFLTEKKKKKKKRKYQSTKDKLQRRRRKRWTYIDRWEEREERGKM